MPGPEREVRVRVARRGRARPPARTPRRRGWPSRTASRSPRRVEARRRRSRSARAPSARTATAAYRSAAAPRCAVGISPGSARSRASAVGVAEQRPPAVAGPVDRRLVPGVEQQDAGRDELALGQRVAVVDDRGQPADQVVARPDPPLGEQPAQVVPELDARLDRRARRRLGRVDLVHQAHVARPRPEVVPVRLRDPEQLGDDRHRQRLDVVRDQVDLAGAGARVEQPVDDGLDPRPHRLDRPRRERLEHEPPQPRVIGRLEVEHPGVVELVERRVPGRRLGPAHLRVRRLVQVGPAETAVAQQPVDVGVPRDEPLRGGRVPQDRAFVAQAPVDRIRVCDERRVRGIEAELEGGHGGHDARLPQRARTTA